MRPSGGSAAEEWKRNWTLVLAVSIASFALTNGSMAQWFALWAVYALVAFAGLLLSGFLIFGPGRYPVWEQEEQAAVSR